MTWRIHHWSPRTGTGTVVSPHFGPWPFGPEQNPFGTTDFQVGEEVLVELVGPKEAYVIRSVVAGRQRQPAGTECGAFAELNATRPGDMRMEERHDTELRFWLGDCCEWCSGSWWLLTFEGVRSEDPDLEEGASNPWFRYASECERLKNDLQVPDGSRAYCVVTDHGNGRDGPRLFIVADDVRVERRHRPSE